MQYADTAVPPAECIICTDPRQYVGRDGQRWTTLGELGDEGYRTVVREEEPGLFGIGVEPSIGIGQRSLVVTGAGANLLWDVPGFVDDDALQAVADLGGLAAVSASHPHFYGVMAEWADHFDVPLVLPEADRRWVTRPALRMEFYRDEFSVAPDVRIVRCGGHFAGSAVVHWLGASDGEGVLLSGDTVTVVMDRDWVSFMWSYPNLIPLDASALAGIERTLAPLTYDRIYGGWWGRTVAAGAGSAVRRSLERYRAAITDTRSLEP